MAFVVNTNLSKLFVHLLTLVLVTSNVECNQLSTLCKGGLHLEDPNIHYQSADFTKGVTLRLISAYDTFMRDIQSKHVQLTSEQSSITSPRGIAWATRNEKFRKVELESDNVLLLTMKEPNFHARWDEVVTLTIDVDGFNCSSHIAQSVTFFISAGFLIDHETYHQIGAILAALVTVTGAILGNGAPTAGNIGKLALLLGMRCSIDNEIEEGGKLMWEFHPIGVPLGDHPGKYIFGSLLCNVGLIVLTLLLLYVVAFSISSSRGIPFVEAQAAVRAPGLGFSVFMLLYPALALASARTSFYPSSVSIGEEVLSWVCSILVLGSPVALWFFLGSVRLSAKCLEVDKIFKQNSHGHSGWGLRGMETPSAAAERKQLEKRERWCKRFLGETMWVSVEGGHFVERYGPLFECYKWGCHRFVLVEMAPILILAFAGAWHSPNYDTCHARVWLVTVTFALELSLKIWYRPQISGIQSVICNTVSLTRFCGSFMLSLGFMFSEENKMTTSHERAIKACYHIASILIMTSTCLIILKGVIDTICGLYVITTAYSTQGRLQEALNRGQSAQSLLYSIDMNDHPTVMGKVTPLIGPDSVAAINEECSFSESPGTRCTVCSTNAAEAATAEATRRLLAGSPTAYQSNDCIEMTPLEVSPRTSGQEAGGRGVGRPRKEIPVNREKLQRGSAVVHEDKTRNHDDFDARGSSTSPSPRGVRSVKKKGKRSSREERDLGPASSYVQVV